MIARQKSLLFIVVAMAGVTASAANSWTKEAWLAHKKDECDRAGKAFNEKMWAAGFERRDLNKDGILTTEELKPQQKVPAKNNEKAVQ